MDNVYWMNFSAKPGASVEDKFNKLLIRAGAGSLAGAGELVAIKVHVGERGNLGYISHNYARLAVNALTVCGAKSFLTDTNTLYSGGRHNAISRATTGAPFVVADGLRGLDCENVPVNGRHVKTARLASGICQADKLVMLSHFKGHAEMGFGGTIKNAGMGCAAVPGKLEMHSASKPLFTEEKCTGCGQCARRCPENAISMKNKKACIEYSLCIGCGQCVAACNFGAMRVKWEEHGETLIAKVSEYASALCNRFSGKAVYINIAAGISPDCDCWDYNDRPVSPDAGIFASKNPLALDRATFDMICKTSSKNIFDELHPDAHSEYLFEYCSKLGMSDAYTLTAIG
jgi:hypothetical protein